MRDFANLLINKNFIRLWISQLISQAVINTLSFLILIRLFEQTGSTIATSFVWVAYALPAIIVGPIGAVASDTFDKRKLLMLANLLQATTILILIVFYERYIFLSYGAVFIYSFFNQFYVPAEASSLPNIVNKKNLPLANSLFFITVQSGLAIGFVFAGVLYEILGFSTTLLIAAGFLMTAFFSVSLLPKMPSLEHLPNNLEKGVLKFFREIIEGYRFIKDTKSIFFPFMLLIGLQVALSVIVVSIPVIASEIVKVKPSLSGLVIGAPTSIGALIGTILVSKFLNKKIRKKLVIEMSLFAFSVSILVLSSVVSAMPFWIGRTLSVISFAVAGCSYVGGLIPTLTYLQEVTPKDLLGRVFGNIWFITTVVTVVPVLFSATITEILGVNLMLDLLGILGVSVVFFERFFRNKFFREVK